MADTFPTRDGSSTDLLRWNPSLSKAFDVDEAPAEASQQLYAWVSRYLDVPIKQVFETSVSVGGARLGGFLSALEDRVAESFTTVSVRKLRGDRESPPSYETIRLNSKLARSFLVDGTRYLAPKVAGTRLVLRVEPTWGGLLFSAFAPASAAQQVVDLLGEVQARARALKLLKGEAFALSGEFLTRTGETWGDLFLAPANLDPLQRTVKLLNSQGAAMESRGQILMGPPGTGKTLAGRVMMNEAPDATFIWISSRDFYRAGVYGGLTLAYDLAAENAPTQVFIEDIDSWWDDSSMDLLKTELDGLKQKRGIVTVLTTNYPESLPAALIDRPGRFHDVLRLDLPNEAVRRAMLSSWAPDAPPAVLAQLAKDTDGLSGAHLRELVRFANVLREQDQSDLATALPTALAKVKDQRQIIDAAQQPRRSRRDLPAIVAKTAGASEGIERAYTFIHVKSFTGSGRQFSGMATTPQPDRIGDIIEPLGCAFANPMPLLLLHDHASPVGTVRFGTPTHDGVPFDAEIPDVHEPGLVKDLTDKAAHMVKYGLVRAVSIGFRAFADAVERIAATGGKRFLKSEILELSLVPVPANANATIHVVKSLAGPQAAFGRARPSSPPPSGVPDRPALVAHKDSTMLTIAEQKTAYGATRQAKFARIQELMTKAGDAGLTLDAAQSEEYQTLEAEVKALNDHLVRLDAMESINKAMAVPVAGASAADASAARGGLPVIHVKPRTEPGIEFARYAMCLASGKGFPATALEIAKERYPDEGRIHTVLKAAVAAGTTTDPTWAGALVDYTNFAGDFVEYLRPKTIIGQFGVGNVPSLTRVPFNIKVLGQSSGGDAWWVGQGAPKPVTRFDFAPITLAFSKVANIAVLTEELVRFSSPSAEQLVRNALAQAVIARIDTDFIDPAKAEVTNISPASITNGVTPIASSGGTEADIRADVQMLMATFIANNQNLSSAVWIMPSTIGLAVSQITNALGQVSFGGVTMTGGTFVGIPVVTSQYATVGSPPSNLVILANAADIYLADDGQVVIDASREASLQMLDNPTVHSGTGTATALVSLWQTNSVGIRAERFIHWKKRVPGAVAYMEDVTWGAGS